jgi:hypothetical protein
VAGQCTPDVISFFSTEFRPRNFVRGIATRRAETDVLPLAGSADRSTHSDPDGTAVHPLFGGASAEWPCLHCDALSTGAEMAANMWHCPKCSATPIEYLSLSARLEKPPDTGQTRPAHGG